MTGLLGETKQKVGAVSEIAEVAFFIGLLYVFYIAPVKVLRGSSSTRDKVAGTVGLLFWATAVATLTGAIQ